MKKLLIYRDFEHEEMIYKMSGLFAGEGSENSYADAVSEMLTIAAEHGLEGNLWHSVLAFILANAENPFSKACECKGKPDGSINVLALNDLRFFYELFKKDLNQLDERFECEIAGELSHYINSNHNGHIINTRIRDSIIELGRQLAAAGNPQDFMSILTNFYKHYGVGNLGLHKAFGISKDDGTVARIEPVICTEHVKLDQIIGYDRQKKKLLENTVNFVEGRPANNCLLYGDAGTGKSSCIKAIMNEFYDRGLRLIEVYKHQFMDLPRIIGELKKRRYRFIIYMDDLSFEEFEIEYKYLKAVIEGGLETKPENVLIYATSNRRHLIKESFNDTKDYVPELHSSDTVQEKLSLVARFGVTIYFGSPEKQEFDNIVVGLARRAGLTMSDEELIAEANKWELSHGGRSGRCAQQFITYLSGKVKEENKA